MKIIWYNADLKTYKFGQKTAYQQEVYNSENSNVCTLLMNVESDSIAYKIINQLNIASELPSNYTNK